jgi:hypothetical protein
LIYPLLVFRIILLSSFQLTANVVLYGKLRFCERGISGGNSEVCKRATSFKLC